MAPESAIQSVPAGGVRAMVLKDLAKAAGFQPTGPGKVSGGGTHEDAPGGGAHADGE